MLKIRELREEEGKTQSEMASIFCVSRQVYANYENGINEPSIEMLCRLADHFDCSIDYLVGRTDSPEGFADRNAPPSPLSLSLLKSFNALNGEKQHSLLDYLGYLCSLEKSGK